MFSPPPTPADEKTLARNYIYAVSAGISGHTPDPRAPCTRGDQPRLIENPGTPASKTIYTRFLDCWRFESEMIATGRVDVFEIGSNLALSSVPRRANFC